MGSVQASKRPEARYKKKALLKRAKRKRERNVDAIRMYGISGHSQCGKKERYDSRAEAETVALRRMIDSDISLRVYHCPICDGWHLTHTEKRAERN